MGVVGIVFLRIVSEESMSNLKEKIEEQVQYLVKQKKHIKRKKAFDICLNMIVDQMKRAVNEAEHEEEAIRLASLVGVLDSPLGGLLYSSILVHIGQDLQLDENQKTMLRDYASDKFAEVFEGYYEQT